MFITVDLNLSALKKVTNAKLFLLSPKGEFIVNGYVIGTLHDYKMPKTSYLVNTDDSFGLINELDPFDPIKNWKGGQVTG